MDTLKALYTNSDGRISRKQWWLGTLGLIVASIVLSVILSFVGLSAFSGAAQFDPTANAETMAAFANASIRNSAWGNLVIFAILAYPAYCLSLKRRHDRGSAGKDVLIYVGITLLSLLLQVTGLTMTFATLESGVVMPPQLAFWFAPVAFALGIFAIYLFVVLGFLRGTNGTNAYGADPLGYAVAA
ncbi:DUF805 domain-containing protein [Devosia sp. 2618]|uniref:DUF805 domain-containing protein n=1 Tax=Devosia sp. 2618 TaxID=3156454 RepID=UPI0033960853